ncbi:hypothetical protein [Piscinibacter defluvii]|uniref:hypothetical protein n=1 Tax=Piscinibacter defluvii TaxID=1796922 RepID=UPI0013E39AE0|nr:hypothetical protein [Piscinibacter defluvii]
MTAPALAALFRAPSVPLHELVMLVRDWSLDAGLPAHSLGDDVAMSAVLIDPDASRRAHWRCAMQLARACERATGRPIADLLADLERPAAATGGA